MKTHTHLYTHAHIAMRKKKVNYFCAFILYSPQLSKGLKKAGTCFDGDTERGGRGRGESTM
ncbi:hypothetical protein BCR41DRAFT_365686 [Lobosporangium transversale]|uniref:Uncharacterized protein n=1 Tax=Lobosporangium transversale TaxID=64571 RepID=A0A1Y2G668_9FUNG|nr:hypothetical protein BCR41DRAFT_365686 [Lobosporangium transversale]ORY93652.1 hypothetical protein BCR41DRAFT_365686 [Lobosporangium transversale]|eukprot:XP_021875147.1 hypothetical protein BCR41DRAFT_365686 [Lobosporangium transversale]